MAHGNSESTAAAFGYPTSDPSSRAYPTVSQLHQYSASTFEAENYADFSDPAPDAPPSPGEIRAFSSSKVRQASVSARHVSQYTNSSAASSLLSHAPSDRRPSWEQALESFSLSRKSSIKSTTSSMPSRERPESVQAIGKAIFNRKAKLRRESLATSSSSTYSSEMTLDVANERGRAASVVSKEHITSAAMNLFNRRKTVQAGEDGQKRPMISNPFNFQHVSQIQKDQLPPLDRANSTTLRKEIAHARSPPSSIRATSRSPAVEDLRVPNFSSKTSRSHLDDESIPPHIVPHSREKSLSRPSSSHHSPPRSWIKHAKSQDQMRGAAPPRPPRSPTNLGIDTFDFPAPGGLVSSARRPSRTTSIPRRDSEALGNTWGLHQQGLDTFRFPAGAKFEGDARTPSVGASDCSSPGVPENRRYSRVFVPMETPNWPLTAPVNGTIAAPFEAGLPNVPEEEEQGASARRSRTNTKSGHSSLKGSISTPALRQASLSNASYPSHDPTFSRESTTLDHFDLNALQECARNATAESLRRDSWEDVIDYCYEHEMEADCDYDWHRPSIDVMHGTAYTEASSEDESFLLSRPTSDVPALSPAGFLSPQTSQEAITPTLATTIAKSPPSANFSLPRRDGIRNKRHLHVSTGSQSNFTEAQGFTLSPSFAIPTDYHHELLAVHQGQYDPELDSIAQAMTYDDSTLTIENNSLFVPARASNSTTVSDDNLSCRSVFERHISTTSSNTDYTRLTMSTTSDMDTFIFKDESPVATTMEDQIPRTDELNMSSPHARSQSEAGLLGSAKTQAPVRDSHGSESNLGGTHAQSPKQQAGRTRSRTMSSTPGQFSLFPAVPSSKAPQRG
ncbi:hypothetical protein BD289DRAFT_483405 [Coniella lustricola]|uniref:Uncharacterized protein n=1 Tax=Coniella lustricola TaxID=2025994 RepID=A0A2T3A5M5_9PEZI|nr:hypothetical protein BD289DRAFT_483405 [Coniella lustricola]